MAATTFVYLIESEIGRVKIGCAEHPDVRLAAIRTHSPVMVRLAARWPGDITDEHGLHARFEACRSHNEWFRIEGEFLKFFSEKVGLGIERVVPWDEVGFTSAAVRKHQMISAQSRAHRANWSNPRFRLDQMIAMRAGRAIKAEVGPYRINMSPGEYQHWRRRRDEITEAVTHVVYASPKGRELLAAVGDGSSEQEAA